MRGKTTLDAALNVSRNCVTQLKYHHVAPNHADDEGRRLETACIAGGEDEQLRPLYSARST